jgi:hypothetical protein
MIDRTYHGLVSVIHKNGTDTQSKDDVIYDYSEIDKGFSTLYEQLKKVTDSPSNRMFKMNAVDTTTGRRLIQDAVFKYPVYKIDNGTKKLVQFNKPKPKFYKQLKFIISMTKGFSNDAIVVSTDDYDVAHLCINVKNDTEVENIKSFIFSDYFKEHSEKWKKVHGYGYNYSLKHLPPFDISKSWNNESVKEFLEGFARAS